MPVCCLVCSFKSYGAEPQVQREGSGWRAPSKDGDDGAGRSGRETLMAVRSDAELGGHAGEHGLTNTGTGIRADELVFMWGGEARAANRVLPSVGGGLQGVRCPAGPSGWPTGCQRSSSAGPPLRLSASC